MPDEKEMTRREALRTITAGAGVIVALPVLGGIARADDDAAAHAHMHHGMVPVQDEESKPYKLQFFTEAENRTVVEMSERIIPADDHSPGAKAAKVSEYIDLIVSQSPDSVKKQWRNGLMALNKKSQELFGKDFADASEGQQVELLTAISKHEAMPRTPEEQFFRTIKNSTIDGYYTSSIGIHQELHYKGNTYLKEFTGCTHPEHQQG
ncbi:MAG TPA: gluconate 2-dehydrogenase subunit 3 family protein [Blastocatellia bacterium]|nr:gluconate 2-dehydrogenase subunit 3 family protein [Blastocatellia bacterium]